jgi:hypothetical protein
VVQKCIRTEVELYKKKRNLNFKNIILHKKAVTLLLWEKIISYFLKLKFKLFLLISKIIFILVHKRYIYIYIFQVISPILIHEDQALWIRAFQTQLIHEDQANLNNTVRNPFFLQKPNGPMNTKLLPLTYLLILVGARTWRHIF